MGNLFVLEGHLKPYIVATDSTLLRSKGHIWHSSSMKEGSLSIQELTGMPNGALVILRMAV
jgi:hypothetical protein